MPRAARTTVRRTVATPSRPSRTARRTPVPAAVTYSKNELIGRFAPLVRHVVERVAATVS